MFGLGVRVNVVAPSQRVRAGESIALTQPTVVDTCAAAEKGVYLQQYIP